MDLPVMLSYPTTPTTRVPMISQSLYHGPMIHMLVKDVSINCGSRTVRESRQSHPILLQYSCQAWN